jgi:aspartokinase/homoserine dehydrogenase 1
LELKGSGGGLSDLEGDHDLSKSMLDVLKGMEVDALVDVTAAETYDLLYEALGDAHVVTSNKVPVADSSYPEFRKLMDRAEDEGRILDIGTTAGAGLRVPDLVERLGCDGFERVTGCLSGTMNYLSQRLNEGRPLSVALREAMSEPRNYAEPDPRDDLGGEDFARKLVIIGRMCGGEVDRSWVVVEDLVPEELRDVPVEEFMAGLSGLDAEMRGRVGAANRAGMVSWYLGTVDLESDVYSVGFENVAMDDMMARSRESDNVVRFYPVGWRRPVTIMGPGAGPPETVTGILAGLGRVRERC